MSGLIFTGKHDDRFDRNSGAYRIRTIASELGEKVDVIDFFLYWKPIQLADILKAKQVDWVGFSLTWMQYYNETSRQLLSMFIQYIRKEYPHIKIIGGGQNILSSMFDGLFDYIIIGYGEVAFIELLKHIQGNGRKPIGMPYGKTWVINGNAYSDSWKQRDFAVKYLQDDFIDEREALGIEFSRGCKFKCSFCNYPMLGVREDNSREENNIYEELQRNYDMFGVTKYLIADETFNDREEKIIKVGNAVDRLSFEPNFTGYIRADLLMHHPEQREMLAKARVWSHFYGIETFNQKSGRAIGKGVDPNKIKQSLLDTRKYFLDSIGLYRGTISLIYGLPFETKETIQEATDWLISNWTEENATIHPLMLDEGEENEPFFNKSKLFFDKDKYGYRTFKCDEYTSSHHSTDFICWENDNMSIRDALDHSKQFPYNKFKQGSWMIFSVGENDPVKMMNSTRTTQEISELSMSHRMKYIERKLDSL